MLITLIIALLSLVVLMVIHEFGHFIIAKKFGVKVEEFGIGYPPRLWGKQVGETLYSINLIPFGAFVRIYGEEGGLDDYRSFSSLAIGKRILIVLGGVIAFWVVAAVIFTFMFWAASYSGPSHPGALQIMSVEQRSPAHTAGLQSGDEILSAKNDTTEIKAGSIEDFQKFITEDNGKPVTLHIVRDGKEMDVTATPRTSYGENEGPLGVALRTSIDFIPRYRWYEAPVQGMIFTGQTTWLGVKGIYQAVASLAQGKGVPAGAELAGPVGITLFLSRAVDYGLAFFLYFVGSLSVLLAIFNLLPIPALDGGKLVFLIFEKIFKKPVPVIWEQRITIFCFVTLILLSLFITIRFDVPRVIDYWKAGL